MQGFVGIEGGASVSKSVLVKDDGTILAEAVGPSLNYLLDGVDVVFERIKDHLRDLRQKSSTDETTFKIVSIGLCLSGCEDEAANQRLEREFLTKNPNVCGKFAVVSLKCSFIVQTRCPMNSINATARRYSTKNHAIVLCH